jgi:hypothetical protein
MSVSRATPDFAIRRRFRGRAGEEATERVDAERRIVEQEDRGNPFDV